MRDIVLFLPITVLYLAIKETLLASITIPDLPLLMVFFVAYKRASMEGAVLGFILGYMDDIFSGAVIGTSSFGLIAVFIVVHLLARKVHLSTAGVKVLGAFLMVALKGSLVYLIMSFINPSIPFLSHVLPSAIVTALFAPAVIHLLDRLTVLSMPRASKGKIQ